MKRIKTFDSFNPNTETVNEEFTNKISKKIMMFLENPSDESIANKLLKRAFIVQFNAKATQPLENIVMGLSLEEKIKMLKEILDKLEYSSTNSLRLIKSNASDKLKIGTIERKNKIPSVI